MTSSGRFKSQMRRRASSVSKCRAVALDEISVRAIGGRDLLQCLSMRGLRNALEKTRSYSTDAALFGKLDMTH